jgi:hypothetical protein
MRFHINSFLPHLQRALVFIFHLHRGQYIKLLKILLNIPDFLKFINHKIARVRQRLRPVHTFRI